MKFAYPGVMGFLKWISGVGGPGSCARWAITGYKTLRAGHPDTSRVSDQDIFRLMVATRYAAIPDQRATDYLEGWMSNGKTGLESLVCGILMAEGRLDHLPATFHEVIGEEMAKSGLPKSVITGPRGF